MYVAHQPMQLPVTPQIPLRYTAGEATDGLKQVETSHTGPIKDLHEDSRRDGLQHTRLEGRGIRAARSSTLWGRAARSSTSDAFARSDSVTGRELKEGGRNGTKLGDRTQFLISLHTGNKEIPPCRTQ